MYDVQYLMERDDLLTMANFLAILLLHITCRRTILEELLDYCMIKWIPKSVENVEYSMARNNILMAELQSCI